MVNLNMSPHLSIEFQLSWIRRQTTSWGEERWANAIIKYTSVACRSTEAIFQ